MALIKSISGIRGTIGGKPSDNLTPLDVVKFTAAFASTLLENREGEKPLKVVTGCDARLSRIMVNNLVSGTLMAMGIDVVDCGLSTTPSVEMAVVYHKAAGGIIITASHNPKNWNALKLLGSAGEFISDREGKEVLQRAEECSFDFASVEYLGRYIEDKQALERHIEQIVALDLVDVEAIHSAHLKIAYDGVCSCGGFVLGKLLSALGVEQTIALNAEPTGDFPHNPEPLPENITDICEAVKLNGCDCGFVVDPDVDRLAIVNEKGEPFVEEYTLVAVSDYVLGHNGGGNTVSNLSSSMALRDVTERYPNSHYSAAAVGEVNVVAQMKHKSAIIGGEGNGGVIYPKLHYGRDALVGIALFLSLIASKKITVSELKQTYPQYQISKNKMLLDEFPNVNVDDLLKRIAVKYDAHYDVSTIDGVKINFDNEWVHLRKSNTEPIIRIYSESKTAERADELAKNLIEEIENLVK
jgi:phosphomannomutase